MTRAQSSRASPTKAGEPRDLSQINRINQAILKTLFYSDIFDYPLTIDEIKKWLIGIKLPNKFQLSQLVQKQIIQKKDKYFFLSGRNNIVSLRKQRKKYSEEKLAIAQKAAFLLKFIPTIKLVGITGALAMYNTKKYDDIDLFIISSKNLLWTTRFLSTILLEIAGLRRHPQKTIAPDKICLNMFMDKKYLEVPKKEQDLFSAHEVLQMKPIWERDNTYHKFLQANS